MPAEALEMSPRLRVERLEQRGRPCDQALHVRILAVENSQRISREAPLAILVERRLMAAEVGGQALPVAGAYFRRAERIDQELQPREAQPLEQPRRQQDDLRIDVRSRKSECLGVDLMELPVSPRLRPF